VKVVASGWRHDRRLVYPGRSARKETTIPQISAITAEQRERIPEFRGKWLETAQSVNRIDPTKTQHALEQLYAELQVNRLDEFLVVASPVEALRQFNAWNTRVGRYLNCLWNYQLPLCDPTAYWRQWGVDRDQIHFASRREPNKHRCYSLLMKDSPTPSVTLGKDLHDSLWVDFRPPRREIGAWMSPMNCGSDFRTKPGEWRLMLRQRIQRARRPSMNSSFLDRSTGSSAK